MLEFEDLFAPTRTYTKYTDLITGRDYPPELTTAIIKLALKYKFNVHFLYPGENACVYGRSVAIVTPYHSKVVKVNASDNKIYVPTYTISAGGDTIEEFIQGIIACLEDDLKLNAATANSIDFKDYAITKDLFIKQIVGPIEGKGGINLFGWALVGICLSH